MMQKVGGRPGPADLVGIRRRLRALLRPSPPQQALLDVVEPDLRRDPQDLELSVVVPVHNGAEVVGDLMHSLDAAAPPGVGWELIFCDDGSTDGSIESIEQWSSRLPVRVLRTAGGSGAAGARNLGAIAARGALLVFVDVDDAVAPDFLREMMKASSRFSVIVPKFDCKSLNSSAVSEWRSVPQENGLPVHAGLPWAYGTGLGVRRNAFFAVGGFDESFRHANEDAELCLRLFNAGYEFGYAEHAVLRYRFRADLWATLKQAFSYGVGGAQFQAVHRDVAGPRTTARSFVRTWVTAMCRVVVGPSRSDRTRALRVLANRAGRLVGTLRWRVPFG